ncbi:hypothetical protein [Rhodoferax sp. BLA1]|uniref:hypothetical protein n=1 Tax=Rhodoferax sp. BLA1 TaxID=2576062 RepID=UPI0015D32127|nr:hypothetical protein [Rhodoferax sp. BLA1]
MTMVIHLPRHSAGTRVQLSARTLKQTTLARDGIARQQAIENALSMALYFVRQPGNTAANVWAATARTNRAFTLLKQASEGAATVKPVNATGRA